MQKVGILGGTFNPPHIGHLLLARWAKEKAGLDKIMFLPAGNPYMKEKEPLPNGEERLCMVSLAIKGQEDFCVSDMEIVRKGFTYTCDTLEILGRENPGTRYYFILGADCLFSIENWHGPERIFASCTIIASARNASPMEELEKKKRELAEKYHARIMLIPFPEMDISSTLIRERLREGKSIHYMVPDAVEKYILDRKLYTAE